VKHRNIFSKYTLQFHKKLIVINKHTWKMLDFPPMPMASKSIAIRTVLLQGCCIKNFFYW